MFTLSRGTPRRCASCSRYSGSVEEAPGTASRVEGSRSSSSSASSAVNRSLLMSRLPIRRNTLSGCRSFRSTSKWLRYASQGPWSASRAGAEAKRLRMSTRQPRPSKSRPQTGGAVAASRGRVILGDRWQVPLPHDAWEHGIALQLRVIRQASQHVQEQHTHRLSAQQRIPCRTGRHRKRGTGLQAPRGRVASLQSAGTIAHRHRRAVDPASSRAPG